MNIVNYKDRWDYFFHDTDFELNINYLTLKDALWQKVNGKKIKLKPVLDFIEKDEPYLWRYIIMRSLVSLEWFNRFLIEKEMFEICAITRNLDAELKLRILNEQQDC